MHALGSVTTEAAVESVDERAILSLHSTIGVDHRVWTLENGVFGIPGLFSIFDRTAFESRLNIGTNGNVGIGTTSPTNRLSVDGNADISGLVGIGTVNPGARLDVRGDVDGVRGETTSGNGQGHPSVRLEQFVVSILLLLSVKFIITCV